MDLVDVMMEKGFLGQDFLTWLWYKSEERGGTVYLPEAGDIQLVFEKHMLLEYGEGESHEKVICQGLQAELKEARTGLAMGKKIEQARILLTRDNYEWRLTLKGSLLELKSVRLPKTMTSTEESDDPAAMEGRILDRISMFELVHRTIDELFRAFLQVRLGPDWQTDIAKIRVWVNKGRPA